MGEEAHAPDMTPISEIRTELTEICRGVEGTGGAGGMWRSEYRIRKPDGWIFRAEGISPLISWGRRKKWRPRQYV